MLKYQRIKADLLRSQRAEPRSELPSIRELRSKYKTCFATLEKVFDELEEENRIRRRWGKGIAWLESRPRETTFPYGALFAHLQHPDTRNILKGLRKGLGEEELRVFDTQGLLQSFDKFDDELSRANCRAIFIRPSSVQLYQPAYRNALTAILRKHSFPFLFVETCLPGFNDLQLGYDNFETYRKATRLFMSSKSFSSRHIFFIHQAGEHLPGAQRMNGFRSGLLESGGDLSQVTFLNTAQSYLQIKKKILDKLPAVVVLSQPQAYFEIADLINYGKVRSWQDLLPVTIEEEGGREDGIARIRLLKRSHDLGVEAIKRMSKTLGMKRPSKSLSLPLRLEVSPELRDFFTVGGL